MLSLLFLGNPLDENNPPYSLMFLASDKPDLTLTEPVSFQAPLLNGQTLLYNQYQNRKAFIAIVTLDAKDKEVHHSATLNG